MGASMKSGMTLRLVYFSLISLFLLSVIALAVIYFARQSRSDLKVYGKVPAFEFTEQNGQPFGTSEMKGEINIVNFFFTSCQGPCPVMNARVAELYQKYATSDQVRFVSISVDPDRDSLSVLQDYAESHGVNDNRWVFLRAPIEEVYKISEKGFMLAGELPSIHSTKLILVDRNLNIRGYYDSFDDESLKQLTTNVRELLN
jgi:protein SCO1/2